MHIPDIIIAIDGYSSTGKSSFAKIIANEFRFLYLDSGALYRGVTLFAVENGLIDKEYNIDVAALMDGLKDVDLHFETDGTYLGKRRIEQEIRSLAIADKVSPIAAVPQVREFVDNILRDEGGRKRVVMDGRDIGTTVFPNAELKIFMTADPKVRAERRTAEMKAKGEDADFDAVLKNLQERDRIDSTRKASPLAKAADAIVLDNSEMTMSEQLEWLKDIIRERFSEKAS